MKCPLSNLVNNLPEGVCRIKKNVKLVELNVSIVSAFLHT